jgi:predicted MPP superfamily phosphohydrolase
MGNCLAVATSCMVLGGNHDYTRHDINKFQGHECGDTLGSKKKFENHMKTHTGKYKCHKCIRTYKTKADRNEHVKNGDCSKN